MARHHCAARAACLADEEAPEQTHDRAGAGEADFVRLIGGGE
jgi:hypothetical protein